LKIFISWVFNAGVRPVLWIGYLVFLAKVK